MVKKSSSSVSAAQEWRERMAQARASLPEGIGQQLVLEWVVSKCPEIDSLTNITWWRNAWLCKVAEPDLTRLVEEAAVHFRLEAKKSTSRLRRQKLSNSSK